MGTSTDYELPSTGNWPSFKRLVSQCGRRNETDPVAPEWNWPTPQESVHLAERQGQLRR